MRGAQRVAEQSGFVLHSYPYSETSLVVESFTREHGRVPLVAKGAKRPRSAWRGVLMPFQPLSLSWSGSGEVKTLAAAEWQPGLPLPGECGFRPPRAQAPRRRRPPHVPERTQAFR